MSDISKAQLEANLRATMQMREAAERAFHRVKEVLVDLALQFLAIEIDQVKVQDADDPTEWLDERAAPGQVQLSGVHGTDEFAGGVTGNQHEIERLQAENRDLRQQSGKLAAVEAELARAQKTIKARFPGEDKPLYVECERGMSKLRSRDNKWSHYATVTPDFCFVVPNNSAQSGVLSEVTEWVIRTRQPTITVRICNLSALAGDQSPIEPIALQVNINCN